jgi:hypothetical protein
MLQAEEDARTDTAAAPSQVQYRTFTCPPVHSETPTYVAHLQDVNSKSGNGAIMGSGTIRYQLLSFMQAMCSMSLHTPASTSRL